MRGAARGACDRSGRQDVDLLLPRQEPETNLGGETVKIKGLKSAIKWVAENCNEYTVKERNSRAVAQILLEEVERLRAIQNTADYWRREANDQAARTNRAHDMLDRLLLCEEKLKELAPDEYARICESVEKTHKERNK